MLNSTTNISDNILLEAIEFFSQKFSAFQIYEYAFSFTKRLLNFEKAAIYIKNEENLLLYHQENFENLPMEIPFLETANDIATFHGTILFTEHIKKYLGENFLPNHYKDLIIPFIVEDRVLGFIVAENNPHTKNNNDVFVITDALMKLFNTALSNYETNAAMHSANKQLDQKIFNLFAINQSSKILLSELDLNKLYTLSIDVFSELTQSTMTGFILLDEKTNSFLLKSMKDTFHPSNKFSLQLTFKENVTLSPNRLILNYQSKEDCEYFESIFPGGVTILQPLKPLYIVFLISQEKLLGLVTLGENALQKPYEQSTFELIESLAYSTLIALYNAKHFEKINRQKDIIQNRFNQLTSLNQLTKNINSAKSIPSLCELTLKTLDVSFDVHKAFIGLFHKKSKEIEIISTLRINTSQKIFLPPSSWKDLFDGEILYESVEEKVYPYFEKDFLQQVNGHAGVLLVPIIIEQLEIEFLGVICILQYRNHLIADQEHMLFVDSIANHIAPTLRHLAENEHQKSFSVPNYKKLFFSSLKKNIKESIDFDVDLYILHIHFTEDFVLRESKSTIVETLSSYYDQIYPISSQHILIIENFDIKDHVLSLLLDEGNIEVTSYRLDEDFHGLEDLITLIH